MRAPCDLVRYLPPQAAPCAARYLVAHAGTSLEQRFVFFDHLEVGRDEDRRQQRPGLLLIRDPTVSWEHCEISRSPTGQYFVRDVSRNGTRINGRRLVPNVETEIQVSDVLAVGTQQRFVLQGDPAALATSAVAAGGRTVGAPGTALVTVLVGDIRDYTGLVRRTRSEELQQSVSRVFEILTTSISQQGGTVKEYQGDAVVAFWEGTLEGEQAIAGCRAVVALDGLVRQLARDRTVWALRDFPLEIDWALATGIASISAFGGRHPAGLSLVGEPVVLAFRLEKLAGPDTARILVCQNTRSLARAACRFRDLGDMYAKGFDRVDHVFALEGLEDSEP